MSIANAMLAEDAKIVSAYGPATPSTAVPDYVSFKNYNRCTIIIQGLNASTVTGSAVTLSQATAVAGTSAKAVPLATYWANLNTAATDTLVPTNATSNTFTTATTNSLATMYVIEVLASQLDTSNNFDCLTINLANAVNTTLSVTYVMCDSRFAAETPPTAIVD